ncbi:hypothetical protein CPB86DRAFT_803204 [Serendipita vermifera]|nr:hypothetical protein CPB86DRAFT_803204 [Serendipita vermifera]
MPRYTPPYPYHSFSTPIDSPAFGSGYEELCPISGLRPCGGPTMLFWDLQECFDMEAVENGSIPPGPYFPFIYKYENSWYGWGSIAIGEFDTSHDHDAHYEANTTTQSDAFFCLRGPYLYLQSCIDRDPLPPRQIAFPLGPDMSFEEEFYEIVNYRATRREYIGALDIIDYEGINWVIINQLQDSFHEVFLGAYELGEALENGLRGNDLIPALLNDFLVWQTCPPDTYE